jgi:hypothetical protein
MEHVVFYPSADGAPAFERVSSLEAAVGFVERLRNSENITEFAVHALTPVPVSLRAYYHVEISPEAAAAAGPEAVAAPAEMPDDDRSAEWVAEATVHEPAAPEPAAASAPFAEAPPVTSPDGDVTADDLAAHDAVDADDPSTVANAEIVPVPSGRRSMGFFTR